MSTDAASEFAPDQEYDMDLRIGFKVIGMVMSFLAFMIILRFGVNICIDVTVLRDPEAMRRTISEFRRSIFPWWRPRTQPQAPEAQLVNIDQLISGLTDEQRKALVGSILSSKTATADDIATWKEGKKTVTVDTVEEGRSSAPQEEDAIGHAESHDSSSQNNSNNIMCSICLHDIEAGNKAVSLKKCGHVFHHECLSEWLCSHTRSRDCPYCRTEIISQEMIEEAYRSRHDRT